MTLAPQLKRDLEDLTRGIDDETLKAIVERVLRESRESGLKKALGSRPFQPEGEPSSIVKRKGGSFYETEAWEWTHAYEGAISALIVTAARQDPEVLDFRQEVLGGRVFDSIEAAREWIEALIVEYGGERPSPVPTSQQLFLIDPGRDDVVLSLPVDTCAALERLKKLTVRLSAQFSWLEGGATLAVLTHLAPITPSYIVTTEKHATTPCLTRIRLEVDPALSAEIVAEIYRRERQKLKKNWHALSLKHLSLVKRTTWAPGSRREQWETWNYRHMYVSEEHTDWAYQPILKTRPFTKEEREWQEQYRRQEEERLGYRPGWVDNTEISLLPADPDEFSRRIECGFANFRRDAALARRRLWDPYDNMPPPVARPSRETLRAEREKRAGWLT